jgi:nitrite reductase/ring-hydroxylating ferredoxin subunit
MTAERRESCDECPAAVFSRRAFFRDVGIAVGAAIAAQEAIAPGEAFAKLVGAISPLASAKAERSYALPPLDGVFVDENNDVILARWQNRAYAFSIRCPHKGTRLTWRPSEGRIYCPKHKARFAADGAHVSGRGSRDLDRYALRRSGETLVVDTSALLRADRDADRWASATVALT